MTIDKSWTKLRSRISPEYLNGLKNFEAMCKEKFGENADVYCPCERHHNNGAYPIKQVISDIHNFGWSRTYETWKYHGEQAVPRNYDEDTDDDADDIPGEMFEAINDVRFENTTNEPDANDGASTSSSSSILDDLDALNMEAETELWPGCTWMSSLNFLAKMLHIKVLNKWTDSSFDQTMQLLKASFPKDNKVPSSYYEAKKKMKKLGLGYESIHACKNDCCLFWKENVELQSCPTCGESRWKDIHTLGKKVPQKVLRYFPLTPRLKRLYGSRHTSEHMTWHSRGRCPKDGKMRHPVDGQAWKDFDNRHPDFASEPRNVWLGLSADGFNPYGNQSLSYSMWPVILTIYNLPPWLCMKESYLMLTLLIPGPKSPAKDMDVFLRPLVDELKSLWANGVQTRDANTNTVFRMRAMLLWTISDFSARSSLSGWVGQGYKACPTCNDQTPSIYRGGKVVYFGHRRFLPSGHPLRRNKKIDGNIEKGVPPRQLTQDEVLQQLAQVPDHVPGKHPNFGGGKRKRDERGLNWSKRSIFFELEYWATSMLKHNLDVMHIEKNVLESLLGTLLMNDKSKDTNNGRLALKALGVREELWLQDKGNDKFLKPHPMYSFTPENRKRFCQFIKGVTLPDGFGSNFKRKVTDNEQNITGMKSHDCHIMMQRLLPVGLRSTLPTNISIPILELCSFFKQICSQTLMAEDMFRAEEQLIKVLCSFEQIFPPTFFDIMIHLVMHLPREALQGGPVFMRWMYPFERYMKKLKNYVRNKARPEGCIAEGYVADEALTFCSMYLHGVQTKFNRSDMNVDASTSVHTFKVFQPCYTTSGRGVEKTMEPKVREMAEWFVLDNCTEIDTYKDDFSSQMPENNLRKEFPQWFQRKICRLALDDPSTSRTDLYSLANGPQPYARYHKACTVNGVKFAVEMRERNHLTQNSGVSTDGPDPGTVSYGQLEEILELHYTGNCRVLLFKCKWYDTRNYGKRVGCETKHNITSIAINQLWYQEEPFILARQAKQVFYLADPLRGNNFRVVQKVNHRKIWAEVETVGDNGVLHSNSSSEFVLEANLDSLTYSRLVRVGESIEVQVSHPPVRNNAGFINDEDEEIDTNISSDSDGLDEDDREGQLHYCSSDEAD